MNVQRGILLNSALNNRGFQIINSCKTRIIPIRQKQVIRNYIFFKTDQDGPDKFKRKMESCRGILMSILKKKIQNNEDEFVSDI